MSLFSYDFNHADTAAGAVPFFADAGSNFQISSNKLLSVGGSYTTKFFVSPSAASRNPVVRVKATYASNASGLVWLRLDTGGGNGVAVLLSSGSFYFLTLTSNSDPGHFSPPNIKSVSGGLTNGTDYVMAVSVLGGYYRIDLYAADGTTLIDSFTYASPNGIATGVVGLGAAASGVVFDDWSDDITAISYSTQLIDFGDSLTVGVGSTNQATDSFTAQLLTSLGAGFVGYALGVQGETTTAVNVRLNAQIAGLIEAGKTNIVNYRAGINDLLNGQTASATHGRISSGCQAARDAGAKAIVNTMVDCQFSGAPVGMTAAIASLNSLIRAGWPSYADGIADLAADSRLQDATNMTYFDPDKTHETTAGYAVDASIIKPVIQGLLPVARTNQNLSLLGVG